MMLSQCHAAGGVAAIGASIGINFLWIGSTPNPSVSIVVAPSSTSDFGRPHRISVAGSMPWMLISALATGTTAPVPSA